MYEKWKRCIEDDRNGPKENERNKIITCLTMSKKVNCPSLQKAYHELNYQRP